MNETAAVQVDEYGNTTIRLAQPGDYLATLNPDGSVLLEPARLLTNAEIAALSTPRRTITTAHEREARRDIARALLAMDPNVTGPAVLEAQHAAGFGGEIRNAYNDLKHVKAERPTTSPPTHHKGTDDGGSQ